MLPVFLASACNVYNQWHACPLLATPLTALEQVASYIPIFFSATAVFIVIGINTAESLVVVVPVLILFMAVLVISKYAWGVYNLRYY